MFSPSLTGIIIIILFFFNINTLCFPDFLSDILRVPHLFLQDFPTHFAGTPYSLCGFPHLFCGYPLLTLRVSPTDFASSLTLQVSPTDFAGSLTLRGFAYLRSHQLPPTATYWMLIYSECAPNERYGAICFASSSENMSSSISSSTVLQPPFNCLLFTIRLSARLVIYG